MSEKTVFLVYGYDNYEYPCQPIKAFESEADAQRFLASIEAHHVVRPSDPGDECSDEKCDEFEKEYAQWRARHPAGDAANRDGFDVTTLQLVESTHDQA